jgi:hypothetical protein
VAISRGCALTVRFRISPSMGPFSFYDASDGGIWFGFDSRRLAGCAWRLAIVEHDFVTLTRLESVTPLRARMIRRT